MKGHLSKQRMWIRILIDLFYFLACVPLKMDKSLRVGYSYSGGQRLSDNHHDLQPSISIAMVAETIG